MTIDEACMEVVAETKTRTWAECNDTLRALVVKTIFEQAITGLPPEEAAKKVVKVRKTRKPKQAPLTQHAEAVGEYAAERKLSGQLVY